MTEKQERVVRAARSLVREHGYAQVSLRDIAAATGYSPAGLYAHFRGRDAILEALADAIRSELTAELGRVTAAESEPAKQLVEFGCAYVRFAVDHPADFELLFRWTRSRHRSRAEPWPSPFEALRAIARRLRPAASDDEIDLACLGLWSAAHGLASLRTSHLADFPGDWDAWTRAVIEAHAEGALCGPR